MIIILLFTRDRPHMMQGFLIYGVSHYYFHTDSSSIISAPCFF